MTTEAVNVSIHAPARGATDIVDVLESIEEFQFTRPRGARHLPSGLSQTILVSIHAPARGATGFCSHGRDCQKVSIHAPARGATRFYPRPCSQGKVSIHAPARGATERGISVDGTLEVSIHAPARGATCSRAGHTQDGGVSIHAPARGATGERFELLNGNAFQFTRPRGARLRASTRPKPNARFNSRAREGRDTGRAFPTQSLRVSIHAPARGATFCQ